MTEFSTRYPKVCARCGEQFTARHPRASYCSDNCRKRSHESVKRADCPECGTAMGAGSAYASHTRHLCVSCANGERRANSNGHEFARLWNEGYTIPELMAHFGIAKGTVSHLMWRYRQQGFDLPYRRSASGRSNMRAAALKNRKVAA